MGHRRQSHNQTVITPKERGTLEHRRQSFTIELFLDEAGEIIDIFIDHNQSEQHEKISGWNPDKLIDFIAQHAGLQQARPEIEAGMHVSKPSAAKASSTPPDDLLHDKKYKPPSKAIPFLTGAPSLRDLQVILDDSEGPLLLLPKSRPFSVRFILDLTDVTVAGNTPLLCEAAIIAKPPGGPDHIIGNLHRRIRSSKSTLLNITCNGLPEGMYRLGALVKLMPADAEHRFNAGITAFIEGGDFVEVY